MFDALDQKIAAIARQIAAELAEFDHHSPDAPIPAASVDNLAAAMDQALLHPAATVEQVRQLCAEAKHFGFASACVQSSYVPLCVELLADSPVKVCSVIGFPHGACSTAAKAVEAAQAIDDGADELDMVQNIGWLKSGQYAAVHEDIRAVVDVAEGHVVKVIIETALLSEEEKIAACLIARHAGAHYVKTSTGFASGGATIEDVVLMRRVVGPEMGVKASGGIRDAETARRFLAAGANRLGVSAGPTILQGTATTPGGY